MLLARIVARSDPPQAARNAESEVVAIGVAMKDMLPESRYPSMPTVTTCVHDSLELSVAVPPNVYSRKDCVPPAMSPVVDRSVSRPPPRHESWDSGAPPY